MTARQSRILQGRDARSVRVLVPDCRGLDQNFHDVTVVDMGDLPEPAVCDYFLGGAESVVADIVFSIAGVGGCFAGAQNVSVGSRPGGFQVVRCSGDEPDSTGV